ncbi:hypothetical protein CROQUDRAFT_106548 [Cronartium quercuum f. sp. fusiforme G11]|uniref:Uncharacterized protein n=1 Tax=Cronartium quercuum f. sp. fusiforme G11 TaxID=708437 RepID=A0A9P6TDX9_9BASI|nr:hypothetical protein CROQUDRAFT_106548 [Cronartium quercuum f. sp. fusiforme G11]
MSLEGLGWPHAWTTSEEVVTTFVESTVGHLFSNSWSLGPWDVAMGETKPLVTEGYVAGRAFFVKLCTLVPKRYTIRHGMSSDGTKIRQSGMFHFILRTHTIRHGLCPEWAWLRFLTRPVHPVFIHLRRDLPNGPGVRTGSSQRTGCASEKKREESETYLSALTRSTTSATLRYLLYCSRLVVNLALHCLSG